MPTKVQKLTYSRRLRRLDENWGDSFASQGYRVLDDGAFNGLAVGVGQAMAYPLEMALWPWPLAGLCGPSQ